LRFEPDFLDKNGLFLDQNRPKCSYCLRKQLTFFTMIFCGLHFGCASSAPRSPKIKALIEGGEGEEGGRSRIKPIGASAAR
jgi:hypothetical protein